MEMNSERVKKINPGIPSGLDSADSGGRWWAHIRGIPSPPPSTDPSSCAPQAVPSESQAVPSDADP